MNITRLLNKPIITPELDSRMGTNINGPSLIRVPEWLPNPLGRYYLYFAHHQGTYIRLAYADEVTGPWTVYSPGTLQLEETPCYEHIASPDVHIDEVNQRLIIYYHGPYLKKEEIAHDPLSQRHRMTGGQRSFVATSTDGIHFESGDEVLGSSYFRVFSWQGMTYALGMPGIFFRSADGFTNFEEGPTLWDETMRHSALLLRDNNLTVFYSEREACPEHILTVDIQLKPDWMAWSRSEPTPVLDPEREYEGGNLPAEPSKAGAINEPVRQLRDPCVFEDEGRVYLLYAVAGERGIGLAEVKE
ncbi:MAG: hypothetical protein AAF702_46145 [Chloroflexota bacterium]